MPAPAPARPRRRGGSIPGALKLAAALAALAILFIVVAILAGGGSPVGEEGSGSGTETVTVESIAPAPTDSGTDPGTDDGGVVATETGFPLVATDNTTRVGGADDAAIAAGAALAVFPSTTDSQRPAAVTLVDGEEPLGAIAAAVLMAEPVRAPLLVSGDELPDATAAAFASLSPRGLGAAGGKDAFALPGVAIPDGAAVEPVSGEDAASTAAAIAALRDRLFGSRPDHIVVAPSSDPSLAAPAAGWAARSGDPVLFAGPDSLPKPSAGYIASHNRVPVYVLGPSSAISSATLRQIDKAGGEVRRVSGKTPVANAIALARLDDGSFGWNVNDPGHGFVLARAGEPLAAAAAAPFSAAGTWGPLLLTDAADTLPPELRDYFLDVKPGYTKDPTRAFYNHVWVIGDQEAIDVNQQAEVNELAELAKIESAP